MIVIFKLVTSGCGHHVFVVNAAVGGWQDRGWGGGLILSNAQKSAATPAFILPVSVVGGYGKKTKIAEIRANFIDFSAAWIQPVGRGEGLNCIGIS